MARIICGLFLLCTWIQPVFAAGHPFVKEFANYPNASLRILFIGNSILYVSETPELLANFLSYNSSQPSIRVAEVGGPNYSLQDHLDNALAKRTIDDGPWDYVIIQQNSSLLNSDPEATVESAKPLVAAARAAHAQPIFYETIGNGMDDYPNSHSNAIFVCQQLGIEMLPVATALFYVHQQLPKLVLFKEDGHHYADPSAYIAACVLYGRTVRRSPVGLPNFIHRILHPQQIVDIPGSDAKIIQDVSWRVVLYKCGNSK